MILPNDTTVAVADGENLRLFRNKGHEPHIELVALDTPDMDADSRDSGGRHRSVSANPDRSRLKEDAFAAAVAETLKSEVLAGRITALYVLADPRSLGETRRHYHTEVQAKLVGELAKDLTRASVETIASAISKA